MGWKDYPFLDKDVRKVPEENAATRRNEGPKDAPPPTPMERIQGEVD